jgi:hypothetical protein
MCERDKFGQGFITVSNLDSILQCFRKGKGAVSASICVNVRRHGQHSYVKRIINRAIY